MKNKEKVRRQKLALEWLRKNQNRKWFIKTKAMLINKILKARDSLRLVWSKDIRKQDYLVFGRKYKSVYRAYLSKYREKICQLRELRRSLFKETLPLLIKTKKIDVNLLEYIFSKQRDLFVFLNLLFFDDIKKLGILRSSAYFEYRSRRRRGYYRKEKIPNYLMVRLFLHRIKHRRRAKVRKRFRMLFFENLGVGIGLEALSFLRQIFGKGFGSNLYSSIFFLGSFLNKYLNIKNKTNSKFWRKLQRKYKKASPFFDLRVEEREDLNFKYTKTDKMFLKKEIYEDGKGVRNLDMDIDKYIIQKNYRREGQDLIFGLYGVVHNFNRLLRGMPIKIRQTAFLEKIKKNFGLISLRRWCLNICYLVFVRFFWTRGLNRVVLPKM